jgi:hydrogenase nickel incorporation protein HypB
MRKPKARPSKAAPTPPRRTIVVEKAVLSMNDQLAAQNRELFQARGLLAINLLSSPGSGKTTLLERTIADLRGRLRVGVIVGDLATENDATRLRKHGAQVVQITTGTVCHLDAAMVARAARQLDLGALDLLVIENVGNLVCPASYDLGEDLRVVLLSTTEGEDKPLKYPPIFSTADVVGVNKIDLAAAAGFDREAALRNIRKAAPKAAILEVSAKTGAGMDDWYALLTKEKRKGAIGGAAR